MLKVMAMMNDYPIWQLVVLELNPEKLANAGGRADGALNLGTEIHLREGNSNEIQALEGRLRANEVKSDPPASLPCQERIGHHLTQRPVKLYEMSEQQNRKVNDVNGASRKLLGSVASGRNGHSKANQVVNKQNPCNSVFSCKENTYIGTWNVRTLSADGHIDILLHQLKNMRWSIM